MKIEHITLNSGNALIRDTSKIIPTVRQKLSAIQLSYESRILAVPALLPLKLRITATEEGAAFDIMKNDRTAVMNACCFNDKYLGSVINLMRGLADQFRQLGINYSVIEPVTPHWLYSAIIDPDALTYDEMIIAGEVELYIFEQLYIAYNQRYQQA